MTKIYAILSLLLPIYTLAQTGIGPRVGLSPIPLWPANGDFSSVSNTQAVFYSPATSEYIVTTVDPASGDRSVRLRVPSHKATDFSVRATVARNGDGTFQYEYSVQNGVRARQAIAEWSIETSRSQTMQLTHSSWTGHVVGSPASEPPQAIIFRNRAQFLSQGADIEPGSSATGFTITSDLAPGFVAARAKGRAAGNEPTAEQLAGLPPATVSQLATCLSDAWDTNGTIVLGPAFAKQISAPEVEVNFYKEIARLTRPRQGQAPSAALGSLKLTLNSAISSDDHSVKSSDLDVAAAAANGDEAKVISALRLSLQQVGALVP